ncbi:MAG: hypothetical protein ACFFAY_03570 [Promethearchaeota archaeon]
MFEKEVLFAVLIGIILFVTDFVFGWMTTIFGRFPIVWVIAIIVGILSGSIAKGVQNSFFTLLFGWLISIPLTPIVLAEFFTEDATIAGILLVAAIWPLRGTFYFEYQGNWIEGLAFALGMLLVILVGTPVIYLIALAVAAIGGLIGRVLLARLEWRSFLDRAKPIDHYQTPETSPVG